MKIRINKNQIDHLTDKGVWIKLPNGSEMFWLSNRCFYPRNGSVMIYVKDDYTYLVKRRTKTAVSFEDYGERIIDLLTNNRNITLHPEAYEPIHHVPGKIKAGKTEVESDLLR